MSFLFGSKKQKSPAELVKSTKEALVALEKSRTNAKAVEKSMEEISKNLAAMKVCLYGDSEHEPSPDTTQLLAHEMFANDLLPLLISEMDKFEFEAKKDVAQIFNNLLRKTQNNRSPAVEYILRNREILDNLVKGYERAEIALHSGSMLRECIRHEALVKELLASPHLYNFFQYVEAANFDVFSDAFATFKDLLTQHKGPAAEFLEKNYDEVFSRYTELLKSKNYVTRRQSLRLLGELLLDRSNFNIMTRYISDASNLKLMMNLLRDPSKNIQFEAFHVFKVFVANPHKPKPILDILLKNKQKLIGFLGNFQNDKEDDQFKEEKAFLLKQISQLEEEKA